MDSTNSNEYRERLARLVYIACLVAIAFLLCRYFSNVLAYIAIAAVISLISKPVMQLLRKIKIKGKCAPEWLLAIVTILILILVLGGVVAGLVPVISQVVSSISAISSNSSIGSLSAYLANFNEFIRNQFQVPDDFKVEVLAAKRLRSILNIDFFGNVLGSVTSTIVDIGIGIFSVVFISFFLIKDDKLILRVILALAPKSLEKRTGEAMHDIGHLLSRYFVGLIIEIACVGAIDFLGVWTIAKLDFESALGIGFLAGLLNVIPYLGPFIGGVLGASMTLILKFCNPATAGIDINFWVYVLILAAIFCFAQLIDNFVLQPLIYSTSIQATPLEIFIILLMAGTIGGVVGILVAIPCYTVVRVIATRFFPDVKFIRVLMKKD